ELLYRRHFDKTQLRSHPSDRERFAPPRGWRSENQRIVRLTPRRSCPQLFPVASLQCLSNTRTLKCTQQRRLTTCSLQCAQRNGGASQRQARIDRIVPDSAAMRSIWPCCTTEDKSSNKSSKEKGP